jgi:outer membrane protein assembly factor BamB
VPTPSGFSSFAVAEGKAFTLVAREVFGALTEGCLALDTQTGQELWFAAMGPAKYPGGGDSGAEDNKGGDGPRSTPAVANGRVFVYSADMLLFCLDAATGKPLWKKDIAMEFQGKNISWKNAVSPVLDQDRVCVAGGGVGQALLVFNAGSGDVVWKAASEAMTHTPPLLTTIGGTKQVLYIFQSGVASFDAANGKALWNQAFPYRTSTACLPVVGGDIVFCTAGYDIGAAAFQVTQSGGNFQAKELYRSKGNKPLGSLWSPPVYHDGHLYGMISFKHFGKGPLKCVDLKTGEVKWEQPGFGAGNVILAGNQLIALADDGQVALVEANPTAYKELGRFKALNGKCWSTPALAEGRLYVRSTKEGACFDLSRR